MPERMPQRRFVEPLQQETSHLRGRPEHAGEHIRPGRAPCDAVRQEPGGQDVPSDGDSTPPGSSPPTMAP
ncbi:hypothetical protein ACIP4Y_37600 [Streptomyces sp. NPDC088810]|uniref:hypothetical protein n=1 Tax=Streptomyces sp. NPDC088810 TaxID=3365904 RepID=UPI0037F105ED